MNRYVKRSFKPLPKTWPAKWVAAIVFLIVILVIFEATNVTHFFHKSLLSPIITVTTSTAQKPSVSSTQKGEQPASTSKDSGPPTSSTKTEPSSNLPLYAPYGDFVSNHHPGIGGSSSQETSVCNTTPGASCYISFTDGSESTKLPSQITNSKGTAYWTWDAKKAGLEKGNWTVTAVASLNGQTKSTRDPLPLSIE